MSATQQPQPAGSGAIFAGTGPHGRIMRVTPDGKASVFYATKQEHILCLALGEGGSLYAGTDKGGLVYRIDAKGKGFVLHQNSIYNNWRFDSAWLDK